MKKKTPVTCLLLDIGGVLLTNGWDRAARRRAARQFKLDLPDFQERHHLTFDVYEEGQLTLDEYLTRVIFYQKRPFTRAQFRRFMFAQSQPYPQMLSLIAQLKSQYGLKIAVVSNEGRELNAYRTRQFKLGSLIDAFISSSYVHLRKPAPEIFQMALDISQTSVEEVVYIENTAMFVQIAREMGIRSILHTDYKSTRAQLAEFGLPLEEAEP